MGTRYREGTIVIQSFLQLVGTHSPRMVGCTITPTTALPNQVISLSCFQTRTPQKFIYLFHDGHRLLEVFVSTYVSIPSKSDDRLGIAHRILAVLNPDLFGFEPPGVEGGEKGGRERVQLAFSQEITDGFSRRHRVGPHAKAEHFLRGESARFSTTPPLF